MTAQVVDLSMKKDDKLKALEAAIGQIEKSFGKGSVMKMGQNDINEDIEAVSTGSLGLDIALGIGGLPKGRIVEIYGPESSGKTTLALHAVAEAQKNGGLALLLMLNMRLTHLMPANWGLILMNCSSLSLMRGNKPLRLLIRWSVPGRLMCW